jgi:folate-binding protein YgfZ
MTATELTDRLAAQAKRVSEYRGAETAAVYTDPAAEFSALRSGCGVYDLGWRAKVVLTGNDRVRWLNGMVTNNVRDLPTGRGVYGFVLTPQGRIVADLYAYNRGDSLLVDTDQGQIGKLLETFDHYIIMDDVEVTNVTDKLTAIGIAGPGARETLRRAGFESSALEPLQFVDVSREQAGVTIVRTDIPRVEAYEIWLTPANVTSIWEALVKAGATPVGSEALELLRIASGIPRYGVDIRDRDLPQETEQERALNFSKGCYIGQEIVERIRSRGNVHRKFTGFIVQGELPPSGTKIEAEGKEIGETTSAATLPASDGKLQVALGYIRREIASEGKKVRIGAGEATVTAVPFAEIFKK